MNSNTQGRLPPPITPEGFWDAFAMRLASIGDPDAYQAYQGNATWTHTALDVGKGCIREMGFDVGSEYLHLDLYGWVDLEKTSWTDYNWELKIAFEHENGAGWDDELCKLCFVVADLRVLVSYHDTRRDGEYSLQELLTKRLMTLGSARVHRVPDAEWLFIFGPTLGSHSHHFRAWTIDREMKLKEITGVHRVVPADWKNK